MLRNQKGATAIEYALLISTFCSALLTVIPSTTNSLVLQFDRFNFALSPAGSAVSGGGGNVQTIKQNIVPFTPAEGGVYGGGTDGTVAHCDDPLKVWEPSIFRCIYP